MTFATRLTYVWLALMALTAAAWWIGDAHGHGGFSIDSPITLGVLAMALIKIRLVIQDFMEVRTAPLWLRLATDLWLFTLFGGVLALYLIAEVR